MDYKKIAENLIKIARTKGYKPGIIRDPDLYKDTGGKSKRKHKRTKRLPPRDKSLDSYNSMPTEVLEDLGKDTVLDPDNVKVRKKIKKRKKQ